jgi:nucleotide-binding universal stress UspA family protein
MNTILVGTDLTDRSRSAIARGAALVQASGGRLIVCHAAPRTLPINPLFPHETGEGIAAETAAEERVADAVTRQVVEATEFAAFDVVVDIGEPTDVLCALAKHHRADLVIVSADRPGVGAVARDLSTSPCSVLVLGPSTGDAVAVVILESELESVAPLVEAARAVVLGPVSKFLVIMWADSDERKAPLLAGLDRMSRASGVTFEPWFVDIAQPSALARVASDPQIGLVALTAPPPDKIVARRAGPLDDGFEGATASFLLLRR